MSGFMSGMAPKTFGDFPGYKFPAGFDVGVGPVADRQQALELQYTSLSGSMNQLNDLDNFFRFANERTTTDSFDQQKETLRDYVKSTWEDIIRIMVEILHIGAVPAPPCPRVDRAVSLFLGTRPMAAQAQTQFQAELQAAAGAHAQDEAAAAGAQVGVQDEEAAAAGAQVGVQDEAAAAGAQVGVQDEAAAAGAQVGVQDEAAAAGAQVGVQDEEAAAAGVHAGTQDGAAGDHGHA